MNKSRKYFKFLVLACILALAMAIQANVVVAKKKAKPVKVKKGRVTIKKSKYNPKTIRKKAPAEITWINKDSVEHTVTADDGSFDLNILSKGTDYPYKFEKAGTYKYHCKFHPSMQGIIIING